MPAAEVGHDLDVVLEGPLLEEERRKKQVAVESAPALPTDRADGDGAGGRRDRLVSPVDWAVVDRVEMVRSHRYKI